MMRRSLACLVLVLPFGTLFAQDSALPSDLVRLVPADCVALLQLRSANELARHVQAIQVAAGEDGASFLPEMLAELVRLPDLADRIDLEKPMALAVSWNAAGPEPIPVFILPTPDVEGFVQAMGPDSERAFCESSGNYVAVAMGRLAPRTDATSRLLANMPAGMISARIDAALLIERFRPLIDAGLDQFEMALDSEEIEGLSIALMYEPYLELVREYVDSADLIDIHADVKQGELALELAALSREGSPFAKRGLPEVIDWRAMAGWVDPLAPVQTLKCYDQSEVLGAEFDFYGDLLAKLESDPTFSPGISVLVREILKSVQALPSHGRITATSTDWAPGGFRMVAAMVPAEPKALIEGYAKLLREPAWGKLGVVMGEPATVSAGEVHAAAWSAELELDRMVQLVPEDERPTEEQLANWRTLMDRLLGKDPVRIALWSRGPIVTLAIGGDEAWQGQAPLRLTAGSAPAPHFVRGIDKLRGANPGYLSQADVTAVLSRFHALGQAAAGIVDFPLAEFEMVRDAMGTKPIVVAGYWGIAGPVTKAGFSIDWDGLQRLVAAAALPDRIAATEAELEISWNELERAIDAYTIVNEGKFPDALAELTEKNVLGEALLEELPADPWGRPFLYEKREGDPPYRLRTLGADGKLGGTGLDLDRDHLHDRN